jgi:SPX domain protein involved in polyphosphate accumulation
MFEPTEAPTSTTSQRVERKYPLPNHMLPLVEEGLRRYLPVYHHVGQHDWVSMQTIYLDTPDLQCYQEYLDRLPVRRKIRVRQYGINGKFDDICWVEIKVKKKKLSLKRRFRCLSDDLGLLIKGEDILDRIAERNEADISQTYHVIRSMILEQELVPAVRVRYERMSFQPAESNGLRVTLDRNVRFASPCRQYKAHLNGLILEVKHHGNRPMWVKELKDQLGMRRAKRFSKFARSIRDLCAMREQEKAR